MTTCEIAPAIDASALERLGLLFYCQHSLGLGHLARSLQLAAGLVEHFDVTLLNGGRLPAGTVVPAGVHVVNLPPLGHGPDHALISHDTNITVAQAMTARTGIILQHMSRRPAALLIELFPFGRKKFDFELRPLLEAVDAMGDERPVVVCSLRDILVGRRKQAEQDERASRIVNRFFDAVVVHADPRFARLDESFHPQTPLSVPVYYTGFVAARSAPPAFVRPDVHRVVVSAGGGMVGGPLFHAAVAAFPKIRQRSGLDMLIVAGPFVPESTFAQLSSVAASIDGLNVEHHVPDLHEEIRRSAVTISQCGYNTTMDILRAGTPAIVVPYAANGEDEQTRRAERLERAGVLRVLPADGCDGSSLADSVLDLVGTTPASVQLDLDGRERTATIIHQLASARPVVVGQPT